MMHSFSSSEKAVVLIHNFGSSKEVVVIFHRFAGSVVVFDLNGFEQVIDLIPNEQSHDLTQVVLVDFSRLDLSKRLVDNLILGLEIGVWFTLNLVASEELAHKFLDLVRLQHSSGIFVQGEEYVVVHRFELLLVYHNLCEVLDGFRVVHSEFPFVSLLVVVWVRLGVRVPVVTLLSDVVLVSVGFFLLLVLITLHD